jgi:hypothetical protein
MIAQESMYSSILLGDLYHWELGQDGYFVVEENSFKERIDETARSEFETFDLGKITEQIKD